MTNDSKENNSKQTQAPGQNQPQYPYPPPYYPEPEDEINLLDLLIVLLKHKLLIIGIVFLTGIGSVIYALSLENIYRSEATIIPRAEEKSAMPSALSALGGLGGIAGEMLGLGGGGSLERFETLLNSRIISKKIYEKHKNDILPAIYEEDWDATNNKWAADVEEPPTIQDTTKILTGLLSVNTDIKKGNLSIKFDLKDPTMAKKMVEYYLVELSDTLREETLKDAVENQKFLSEQIEKTADVLLKEKIYALLAKEIEKETFARAQNPYSFQILDPPIISDLDKRVKPKRRLICMLSVIVAFFIAVFLAFFIEYIQNIKNSEDPERIERFQDSLKLRNRE
ncbi:MAG: hypothetical protein JRC89_06335 [Deltaproteobacteria bacterium]|nr:hypothetical protein [Deltaproteobacteria bacterium]